MSISTYQFAHNSPVWKVELEGLEGEPINEKDVITHEPIKVQQARGPGPIGPMVATGKVVQETTKEVAKQSSTLKNVIKLGGTAIATVFALLTDTMSPNTGGQTCEICLHRGPEGHGTDRPSHVNPFMSIEETAIDEKLKVDDKIVKTEGDSDSPIKRMGDFDEEKEESDSSKNEKHGDKGRALSKAEKQIEDLQKQMEGANKKTRKKLQTKIKNIRETAQRKKKGEEHSKANKH